MSTVNRTERGTSEGEFKELTRAHDLHPLGIVEPLWFDLPPGEGAPLKCEGGWGEFLPGSRGEAPLVGLGKAQGFSHASACFGGSRKSLAEPTLYMEVVPNFGRSVVVKNEYVGGSNAEDESQ